MGARQNHGNILRDLVITSESGRLTALERYVFGSHRTANVSAACRVLLAYLIWCGNDYINPTFRRADCTELVSKSS